MAKDNDDFLASTVTDDFNFVRHNETDFDGFKDFQKEIDERFAQVEIRRRRSERISNLEKWDSALTGRWRDAKLNLIEKPVIAKIKSALEKQPAGSFFLTGESGAGKSFVAYAVIRRMVGHGTVSPSQVKTVSESVLSNWAFRGFQGQDQLSAILSSQHKLFLFDGIGTLGDHEQERVAGLWEQIIDHIYTHDLTAIFTSVDELDTFSAHLSPSGETKLRTLVDGRTFKVEPTGSLASKKKL